MGILDVQKLWRPSCAGGHAGTMASHEEVLAYVGMHGGEWACKQPYPAYSTDEDLASNSTTDTCAPHGGDSVPDGDLQVPPEALMCQGQLPADAASTRTPTPETPPELSREDTLLIFDWDDTILCSSWLSSQGLKLDKGDITECQHEQLSELARVASETLQTAKEMGTVVIVTNAERGWIELTCHKFMPSLLPVLEGVKLVSARTSYESAQVPTPLDWKLRAFDHEVRDFYGLDSECPDRIKNVLSFGDSVHEREALMRTAAVLPSCLAKTLKFLVKPDVAQICQQHKLVQQSFDVIVRHRGNLDLFLQCA